MYGKIKLGLYNSCQKSHIDLRDKLTFTEQLTNKDCFHASKKIITQLKEKVKAPYDCYQVALEENGVLVVDEAKMTLGLAHLDKTLEEGFPLVVGINHTINYKHKTEGKINKGTTDHFVAIVARYCEKEDIYYQFWDVGTKDGDNEKYRFKLMPDKSLVCEKDHKNRLITVTQIR